MEITHIMWALTDLGVDMDYESYTGTYKGRNIRVNCNATVDIGDNNFDRWANSCEITFNPVKKKFARQFKNACKEIGAV